MVREMKKTIFKILAMTLASLFLAAAPPLARTIFVNGRDVSSVRGQTLKNVDVIIDEKGDVVITAPNYQVKEQELFRPLGTPKLETPPHAAPKKDFKDDLKSELPKPVEPAKPTEATKSSESK